MRPYAQITAKLGGDIPGKAGLLQKAYNPAWQSQRSEQKKQALASYIQDIRFSFICLFLGHLEHPELSLGPYEQ